MSDPDRWDGAGRSQASLELAPTGEEALPHAHGLPGAPALGSPPGISCTGGAAKEPGARSEALILCVPLWGADQGPSDSRGRWRAL